ncbi:MAG TPA: glycosyltransferase family 39 protein [Polyangia bacterium]|nr:glycosyltransferase family 39 protein [Polyangia bacterium]
MASDANVDRRRQLVLGGLATWLYLATAPAVVNPDGLGYLKLLPHNFAAGHLAFMPLLRALTRLFHGDGLRAGRLGDALLGGTGVVLLYGIVRRVLRDSGRSADDARFAATFAAAGLALSYGYWIEAADVEAYAAATVALLSTVRLLVAYGARPTLLRALACGALVGASVLCHVEHVLLAPLTAAYLLAHAPSRRAGFAHAAAALAVGGALALDVYAYAAFAVREHDLAGALRWVGTAAHGFRYQAGAYRLADAVYGLCKSLVYAPYLHEADAPRLLGQFLLGLLPFAALGALTWSARGKLPQLEWRLGAWWIAPYALFALAFFGSDPERWLFVLPALWLLAGALTCALPRRRAIAAGVLGYLLAINLATGILPARRDADGTRFRAESSARQLRDGDLVIFPGHSWDEYISFFGPPGVEPFPVCYYVARDGADEAFARLGREIDAARAHGGRVFAARLFDENDVSPGQEDRRGWDELLALGFERAAVRRRVLDARPHATLARDAAPLARLDWP